MSSKYTMVLTVYYPGIAPSVSYVHFNTRDACISAVEAAMDWRTQRNIARDAFMIEDVQDVQVTPVVVGNN